MIWYGMTVEGEKGEELPGMPKYNDTEQNAQTLRPSSARTRSRAAAAEQASPGQLRPLEVFTLLHIMSAHRPRQSAPAPRFPVARASFNPLRGYSTSPRIAKKLK